MPLAEARNRGGGGGRNPAKLVAGGEGEVGEELEQTELYPFVGSNKVGDGQRCAPRGEQWAAVTAGRGGSAPASLDGGELAEKLHRGTRKVAGGPLGARWGGGGGSAAGYGGPAAMALAGVLWTAGRSSGGLLGREREEWKGEGATGSK